MRRVEQSGAACGDVKPGGDNVESSRFFEAVIRSAIFTLAVPATALLLVGCQADSAQDQINNQYASDFQIKAQALQPMVGVFQGKVHLLQLDQDFDCQIILSVVPQTENSPQSEDPSETVQVARLGGSIAFPALQHLPTQDYAGFQDLLNPLDDLSVVKVDYGDYNPNITPPVTLPYLAQDQKTDFGTFSGQIIGDEFTGIWFADDFGNVGRFDLHRTSKTPAALNGGSNP